MKSNVSKRHTIGKLQHEILEWLAKHKDLNRQAIAKKLRAPHFADYTSVHKAMRKLEEREYPYVATSLGVSQKNKPMPLYRLSEYGIAYILTNPKTDKVLLNALIRNYPSSHIIQICELISKYFGSDTMKKVRIYASRVYLETLKQVKTKAITNEQVVPVAAASLFTHIFQLFPVKEEKLEKFLKDLEKIHFEFPSSVEKNV